jgi:hypothetical protein
MVPFVAERKPRSIPETAPATGAPVEEEASTPAFAMAE